MPQVTDAYYFFETSDVLEGGYDGLYLKNKTFEAGGEAQDLVFHLRPGNTEVQPYTVDPEGWRYMGVFLWNDAIRPFNDSSSTHSDCASMYFGVGEVSIINDCDENGDNKHMHYISFDLEHIEPCSPDGFTIKWASIGREKENGQWVIRVRLDENNTGSDRVIGIGIAGNEDPTIEELDCFDHMEFRGEINILQKAL